jgi:rubrerythrin
MFSGEEIVRIAVRIEKNGEKTYREAAAYLKDAPLKKLLEWMADEEALHVKWFEDFLQDLGKSDSPMEEALPQELLEEILDRRIFSLEEVDFRQVENRDDLIRTSIEFEEDTVLFYEMLQSFIKETNVVEALEQIIAEERNHIRKFQEFLETQE